MTDIDSPTRVTFEFDPQSDGLEVWADDRTPTGLSRYGEQVLRTSVEQLAYGNVFVDSVRIERVEETTSAEPMPVVDWDRILSAKSVSTFGPAPVAVAEELDLDAFIGQLDAALTPVFGTNGRSVVAEAVRKLLTDGSTPTKPTEYLHGRGLNREQLTGVISHYLHDDQEFEGQHSWKLARGLVAAIEAAQLDGTLS
jgi:hypothetical protein